jgi:hypothetical protein
MIAKSKAIFMKLRVQLFVAAMIAVFLVPQAFTFASVTISIDTDALFTSVNTWIATFIGPLSIGIGIAVALALITFIGAQIIGAFRGGGRR